MKKYHVHKITVSLSAEKKQFQIELPDDCKRLTGLFVHSNYMELQLASEELCWVWLRVPGTANPIYCDTVRHFLGDVYMFYYKMVALQMLWQFEYGKTTIAVPQIDLPCTGFIEGYLENRKSPTNVPYEVIITIEYET